jgi:hypothetical protein
MKKLLLFLIILCTSSCIAPYSTYDYDTPRYNYYPHVYQPTRVIVKQKHKHKHKHKHRSNKRHVKVKINKHRKIK